MGNGVFGAMMWGDGAPLSFTLDRADLWDTQNNLDYMNSSDFNYANLCRLVSEKRFDEVDEIFEKRQLRDNPVGPTKVSIGRASLFIGEAIEYECTLNIDNATVFGNIGNSKQKHTFESFVHHDKNVLCLRVDPLPSEARMKFIPLMQIAKSMDKLNHPAPIITEEGNIGTFVQEIPQGLFYAVVWNCSGSEFFVSAETASSAKEALGKAMQIRDQAARAGFEMLRQEHLKKWQEFWSESAICLPEAELEFFWYYGIYLLASSAKKGSTPPGLQGLWAMDGVIPPWRGDYHGNMNVQETFWPACASGHLDLLDCWCDYMKLCIEPAKEFTRKFFGTEGTFWPCCTIPTYTIVTCWHTVQFAWASTGWLTWLVWLRWRYSMDINWLRTTGYPVVAEAFRFFRSTLVLEKDGLFHIPLSSSAEYENNTPAAWCKDPNIDIAVIRRCCDWVIEMEEALGINDLSQSAREVHVKIVPYSLKVHAKLVPYSLTDLKEKKELCLWPGKLLDEPHRHPSHLMAIHPIMDMTIDGDENTRAIIEDSVEQYLTLGQYFWAGHSYAQLISFASVLGRGGWAYECLTQFANHWVGPNGLHLNRDFRNSEMTFFKVERDYGSVSYPPFTMEANCAVSAGISDMLVQGWGDIIRIFPALADNWRDVAFFDLLTEGAWKVSALYRNGRTVWAKITAGVDRELRLRDPFNGDTPVVKGCEIVREADILIMFLKKGQTVELSLKNEKIDFGKELLNIKQSDTSFLGLK
jgi:alpha-L-fucosidase 2